VNSLRSICSGLAPSADHAHRGQQPILARSIDETGICCQMDKFCCCRLNRSIDPPG
jgi:hypothetical protein